MIVIMGSGNIGSLIGGLLADKDHSVVLIGRSPHMDVVSQKGLSIEGLKRTHVFPYAADGIKSAEELIYSHQEKITYAIITTKAHQTLEASKQLEPLISNDTTIISMQNGIGTENIAKNIFENNTVLRGVTAIGAYRPKPGVVRYGGLGNTLIGYNNKIEKREAKGLAKIFNKVELPARISSNIKGAVYTKTIVNCALNPVAALNNVKNIDIYRKRSLRRLSKTLAYEAWNVTKKMGIKLTTENPVNLSLDVARNTGENINSMLSDVLLSRKTEIEFLNGTIVSQGNKLGVKVNTNRFITQKILSLEKSYS